jgi:hypothetical protein
MFDMPRAAGVFVDEDAERRRSGRGGGTFGRERDAEGATRHRQGESPGERRAAEPGTSGQGLSPRCR